ANEYITIEGIYPGRIEIMNLQGKIIKKLNTSGTKTEIDISKLESGVYTIRIETNEEIIMNKFVKE
ncbi:MAG: T9SS type A sorting domain-containing protein, partial [Bacteroidales bacterium]|nr:T9SS type A sorting domain-containing protein [Bacteroidales bacterium]